MTDHSIPHLERFHIVGDGNNPAGILVPKHERVFKVVVLQIKTVAL
jgi:hypothetical protein